MPEIYPDNFEQKIGFDRVRLMLLNNCISPLGKEEVENMAFCPDYELVDKQCNLVVEFLRIIIEHSNFPTSYYFDLRKSVQKIRIEGSFLETAELFDLKRSLDALQGIVNFFKATKKMIL
jgi:DNA mismatch repair protein MutS2